MPQQRRCARDTLTGTQTKDPGMFGSRECLTEDSAWLPVADRRLEPRPQPVTGPRIGR